MIHRNIHRFQYDVYDHLSPYPCCEYFYYRQPDSHFALPRYYLLLTLFLLVLSVTDFHWFVQ
uniref:Uncharacterized protein n=1 Tax=Schistosoma curassoni TaxID=6186 RepID=A0A183JCI3_9TREM